MKNIKQSLKKEIYRREALSILGTIAATFKAPLLLLSACGSPKKSVVKTVRSSEPSAFPRPGAPGKDAFDTASSTDETIDHSNPVNISRDNNLLEDQRLLAIEDTVYQIACDQLDIDLKEIQPNSHWVDDLGADSLAVVELVLAIEEALDIDLPDEDMGKISTVQQLVEYLFARLRFNDYQYWNELMSRHYSVWQSFSNFITINDSQFVSEVEQAKRPVLVLFGATWSGPTKPLIRTLKSISHKYKWEMEFRYLDIQEAPMASNKYGVHSVPTLFFFKNGSPVGSLAGDHPQDKIEKWLREFTFEGTENRNTALSILDVANMCRVSVETVRRWIRKHGLKAHKSDRGKATIILENDLKAFAEELNVSVDWEYLDTKEK